MTALPGPKTRLTGERCYLRTATLDDCNERYVAWLNDPEVNRFLETRWTRHDLASVRAFVSDMVQHPDNYLLAICELRTDLHIGNIKLGPINRTHRYADVSYFIGSRQSWGKGIATDAIREVTRFALDDLGLHRVQAGVYNSNVASARALERVGYRLEGRLHQKLRSGELWEDHLLYGMTKDQWEEAKAKA